MSTTPDRLEPRWTRPEVALVTCAGGDGSPPNIAGWHDHLADVEVCTPAPPPGPGQSKRIGSGPDRLSPHRNLRSELNHDESRSIVDRRGATPTRMARTPSVVSSWTRRLEKPPRPGAFAPCPNPPGIWRTTRQSRVEPPAPERTCSREIRCQAPRLRGPPGFQGRRSPSPAKGSAIGRTQGAFHHGELPEGLNLARQAEADPDRPRVGPCPQVVPILWRRCPRLFYPAQALH